MALSVVVMLIEGNGLALIRTNARHWPGNAVSSFLEPASWIDISEVRGYSDYITDLDAAAAARLLARFRPDYLPWLKLNESSGAFYRRAGEHRLADEYEEVVRKDKAELAALDEIVRRAGEEQLQVRLLLEEWDSGL